MKTAALLLVLVGLTVALVWNGRDRYLMAKMQRGVRDDDYLAAQADLEDAREAPGGQMQHYLALADTDFAAGHHRDDEALRFSRQSKLSFGGAVITSLLTLAVLSFGVVRLRRRRRACAAVTS